MPEYGTPDWYNAIGERATKRILELTRPLVDQYLKGGYAGGFAPVTLATLRKMPIASAVQMLRNMMSIPTSRAEGVSLFAQYLDFLESSGQLAPGAAKLLGKGAAAAQVRSEIV